MKKDLLARLFVAVHEVPFPVLQGWAHVVDGGCALVRSPEGVVYRPDTQGVIRVGEGRHTVSEDNGEHYLDGALMVSDETCWIGYQARPTRKKNEFMIDAPGGRVMKGALGASIHGMGTLTRLDSGRLSAGGKVLLETKKVRELSLIVLDDRDERGFLAYFNVLSPGSRAGGATPRGVSGRLVRDDRGARFMEVGSDDQWHDTARFYEPSGSRISAALRTLDAAEASRVVDHQWALLQAEARDLGLPPSDFEEHDDLVAARESLSKAWQRHAFTVAQGREWIHSHLSQPSSRRSSVRAPF